MSCEKYVHLSTHCHNQLTEPNILFHFKNSLPFCSQSIPNLRPWQPPMVFYYYSLSLVHSRISYKLNHTECSIFFLSYSIMLFILIHVAECTVCYFVLPMVCQCTDRIFYSFIYR